MAARLNRHHTEEIRQKIQASNIIHRLQQHVNGEVELSATQVAAANSLLDRSVPKLSQIQHVGDEEGGPIQHSHQVEWVSGKTPAASKA
jgi:hypothetical protein